MNLITIKDMIDRFGSQGVKIGLSDHSMSIIPPVTAVALGATIIEKHFTLDRSLGGADSGFSLNKQEFADMVIAVRETEKALGKIDYMVDTYNRGGGRSLYIAKDLKKGDIFTSENLRSVRPAKGLHPRYYEEIIGKKSTCDLAFGTAMKLEYVERFATRRKK